MTTSPATCSKTTELDPAAGDWVSLLSQRTTNGRTGRTGRFREQLGLSADKPIVMTGHQAQFWHPGILAKLFAAQAVADKVGGQVVWLVVDIDTNDPLSLRVPARSGDGPMHDVLVNFVPPAKRGGVKKPTGVMQATEPAEIELGTDVVAATEEIGKRLTQIREALIAHSDEQSAARQVTRASFDLLGDVVQTPTIIYASDLVQTELFDEIRTIASTDPAGFASAFNDAVAGKPDSGVAPVSLANEELPMWRLDERGRRHRAKANDARDQAPLLPSGLLMTGLVRLAGCDLFVHGTGGRAYEPINDAWLSPILGGTLAPFTTATATLLIEFDEDGIVSQDEARRARWIAHHARHDPGLLGDVQMQAIKRTMLAEIEALPRRSVERVQAYRSMHTMLAEMRIKHADRLEQLHADADIANRRSLEYRLRSDRTWAAALHDPKRLGELGRCIAEAFGA